MGFFSGLAKAVAGPLIGGLIGGVSSAYGAAKQNEAAQAASQKQMDFQERMRETQYQTAMGDMRKAGLNPILAYQQGGAGTPGGSSYSPVNVGAAATTGALSGVSSAVARRKLSLEERKNIAEIDKLYTSAGKDSADADLATHQRMNVQVNRQLLKQQFHINQTDVTSAKAANRLYKGPAGDFFKWWQMLKRR